VNTKKGPGRLGDVGVQFQRDGLLTFENEKFENFIENDYLKAAQILTGYFENGQKVNGFVDNLENVVNSALQNPSGTLFTRNRGFESNIRDIDRRVENKQRQLERKEENLKQKFARLEETMARIRTQGSGLAGLQGGSAVNPVQQLG
ncbi:flagellar filament capping protein FliD, partial [Bacteriovoracaceae bacterium]|nr:flagellar filament capping protein FliD [Bacteriovoracaceae bacterium]